MTVGSWAVESRVSFYPPNGKELVFGGKATTIAAFTSYLSDINSQLFNGMVLLPSLPASPQERNVIEWSDYKFTITMPVQGGSYRVEEEYFDKEE